MLKGYSIDSDGVISQVDKTPINYDENYISLVGGLSTGMKELSTKMSYLRLGYVIGSIGKVPNSILDVGYGDGDFLNVCKQIISECYGNDVSPCPVPEGCYRVELFEKKYYDVVTFFDSLEHFPDIEFVKDLNCKYVCISVPHCHYFDDDWFLNWKHRKPSEHIWHFNEKSLTSFMRRMGFELVNCTNLEDTIRKNNKKETNILTCLFKKL